MGIISEYIESSVTKVLDTPENAALGGEEKDEVRKKLTEHFENLVLETTMTRLSVDQLKDVQANLSNPEVLDQKISEYSAAVPNLAQDIEDRLSREVEALTTS